MTSTLMILNIIAILMDVFTIANTVSPSRMIHTTKNRSPLSEPVLLFYLQLPNKHTSLFVYIQEVYVQLIYTFTLGSMCLLFLTKPLPLPTDMNIPNLPLLA